MYEDKTPEAIKAEILAAIRQSQGLSAMAGGFADGVAGPVAEQLSEAYRALEGVENFASLTVNGGTADVTIQAGEIPVLGEVSVT